ncbi:hypothetical protein NUU61_001785 [Penicillium alfredii]|uniref:Uncharacterized protein n=1 Tax=Penicillium alfredii TaxID=1506179 RepID=A0A9W9FQB2_9EURO|nr:uncharacterized protein NUU61_001785 [Penicillium alfredii]KAJ5104438.1 hypothetical protein NUU61_001785 [Penicillium alfredii]
MVLGVVMMSAMLPTMIGLNEATQGARNQEEDRRDSARKQRCHLLATCSLNQGTSDQREQVHNARVYVGQDGNLYITKYPTSTMAPLNGGFYTHPDFPPNNTSGLVTVSGEQTPTLRWVFLDAHTHQMRWGGRPDTQGHICGPFDWTRDMQYVTLEGWEGWLAVRLPDVQADQVENGGSEIWRLYFDRRDNGADLPPGAEGLEIRLKRAMAES